MFQNRRRLLPVILYTIVIFALSSIPSLTAPGPSFDSKDKIAHTLEYLVLGVLLFRWIGWGVTSSRTAAFGFLFAIGVTVAAVDELYQGLVPGRVMSVADWCADALGIAIGVGMFVVKGRAKSETNRPRA